MKSKLSVKSRYRILCKIYNKYRSAIKLEHIYKYNYQLKISYSKVENILDDIPKFPIPWKFYVNQNFKFSSEFEDLIIFTSE